MAGRPTAYKEEYNAQAEKLCKLGFTDAELAAFFEVNEDTVNEWKKVHPEFSESLKKGKDLADAEVASKLYHRATGYSHPDVDIKMYEGQIIETPLIKHYPPDTAAAIIWLKNRQKSRWRDRFEQEVTIPQGLTITYKEQFGNAPLNDTNS
jgi:cell fate (sporulation/competence/biofilm development) regulator YmcA (YheA/YmcA/DUF963 family)